MAWWRFREENKAAVEDGKVHKGCLILTEMQEPQIYICNDVRQHSAAALKLKAHAFWSSQHCYSSYTINNSSNKASIAHIPARALLTQSSKDPLQSDKMHHQSGKSG